MAGSLGPYKVLCDGTRIGLIETDNVLFVQKFKEWANTLADCLYIHFARRCKLQELIYDAAELSAALVEVLIYGVSTRMLRRVEDKPAFVRTP